jgi:hypothetical protein
MSGDPRSEISRCPACTAEGVRLKDVGGIMVCEKCSQKRFSAKVRKTIAEAFEKQVENKKREAWRKRIEVARKGVKLFKEDRFVEALRAFREYITILETRYKVSPGELHVNLFDSKKDAGEILLIAGAFWDMARIYDKLKGHEADLRMSLNKFIEFSIDRPHIILTAECIRKHIHSGGANHVEDFKNAHLLASSHLKRCFIASAVFGENSPEVELLRAFRDQVLIQNPFGRACVNAYYRLSPPIALALRSSPQATTWMRVVLQTITRRISKWFPALVLTFVVSTALHSTPVAFARAKIKEPKVVLFIIDGVRNLEIQGKAKNDEGKPIRAEEILPNLMSLKKSGAFFPSFTISNPVGISLPAYADLFTGRRQDKIMTNHPSAEDLKSHYPTIFQTVKKGLGLGPDGVALFSAWDQVCAVATTGEAGPDNDFYRSCGWKNGKHRESYFKPEQYPGTRSDMDTFVEVAQEVTKLHPRFITVHLLDADGEGHFHTAIQKKTGIYYGIFQYHQALREDDYFMGRIWKMIQADPFYKDSTYLIVTTDHGRDNAPDPNQWAEHGTCLKTPGAKQICSGCRQVFAIAVGPGIKHQVVRTPYTHANIAPTIAALLGTDLQTAQAQPISELLR